MELEKIDFGTLRAAEKQRHRKLEWARWLSFGSFVSAILTLAVVGGSAIETKRSPSTRGALIFTTHNIREMADQLKSDQASLKADVADLRMRIEAITAPENQIDQPSQVASLTTDVQSLSVRIELIESAIVENPTKALSVPLMRNDLESLKASFRDNRDETARQIDRVYDLSKWLIGGLAIAILGLAASNYLQSRASGAERRNDTVDTDGRESLMTADSPPDQ